MDFSSLAESASTQAIAGSLTTPELDADAREPLLSDQIRMLFRKILAREPTQVEVQLSLDFLNQVSEPSSDPGRTSMSRLAWLAQALLISSEFCFVDLMMQPEKLNTPNDLSRRSMLLRSGLGFGALALHPLLQSELASAGDPSQEHPMAAKPAHFPPRAKRIIHIFANGGPSHIDTFDPKPALHRYAGQPIAGRYSEDRATNGALMPSPFQFRRYGESGIEVSELFPHTAQHVDDMCIIRSMAADVPNHEPSLLLMNTGEARLVRPSVGSWLTYGPRHGESKPACILSRCARVVIPSRNRRIGRPDFYRESIKGPTSLRNIEQLEKLIANIKNGKLNSRQQTGSIGFGAGLEPAARSGETRRSTTGSQNPIDGTCLPDAKRSRRSIRCFSRNGPSTASVWARRSSQTVAHCSTIGGTRCSVCTSLARRWSTLEITMTHRKGASTIGRSMRSSDRSPTHRPQASRDARRYAGHMGWRIRANAYGRTSENGGECVGP